VFAARRLLLHGDSNWSAELPDAPTDVALTSLRRAPVAGEHRLIASDSYYVSLPQMGGWEVTS
jgi:hypothetical protein